MLFTVILQFNMVIQTLPYPAHMVLILFVQVLSLKFEPKNPEHVLLFESIKTSSLMIFFSSEILFCVFTFLSN